MRFDDLKLMPLLLQNVQAAGYETPTPIQQATIPLVLAGKDVLGCAQTGTGKTAAFALPIIQQLAKKPTRFGQSRAIRALILTPTRELAQQIYDNFVLYGKKLPVYPTVIFGGVNQQGQVNALRRGADVLRAPGAEIGEKHGLFKVLPAADEKKIVFRSFQLLPDGDLVDVHINAPPGKALAHTQNVAPVAVKIEHVRVQMADVQFHYSQNLPPPASADSLSRTVSMDV